MSAPVYPLRPDSMGNPYPVEFPPARDVGAAPFWQPGEVVRWHFRRHDYRLHGAEVVQPVRVVEDSPRGTIVWLPGDTPTVEARLRGFDDVDPHDVPSHVRFVPEASDRVMVPGSWHGTGVLRIVPADLPFSVWLFFSPHGDFRTWYVNLEHRHLKGEAISAGAAGELYTADHILDLVISPDGTVELKDEDELADAVAYGQFTAEVEQHIRRNADIARAAFLTGHWAFDRQWTRWFAQHPLEHPEAWRAPSSEAVGEWLEPGAAFVGCGPGR